MALLPSFFILQSGSKYLSLTENVPPGLPSGLVKFDEEQIWSPRTKFAAEPAETGDGRFVHIRSLYNNKYLVKKQIDDDETKSWIVVASAKKPEEDTSRDSCTLFEAYSQAGDQPTSVRLRHVPIDDEKNSVVTLSSSSDDAGVKQGLMLLASSSSSSRGSSSGSSGSSVFSAIDRQSLVVLPSRIAIKWNDLYMRAYNDRNNYERFDSGFEIADPLVAKELVPTGNGYYCIRDSFWGKFFKYHTSWIWADDSQGSQPPFYFLDTTFSIVHLEDNVFGIRSLANNCFCGPLTADGKTNCLNAYYTTLTNQTWLILEELVRKREIFDIEYRLSDARIYGEQPIEVDTQTTSNFVSDPVTTTLSFKVTDSRTTSWTNSQTISFGVSVSMSVSVVPFISSVGIELRTDYTSTHEWGDSKTTETSRETIHTVTVPPGKTYVVTLMATMGKCDVPFSYTQRDLLLTGETVQTRKHDGLFADINSYNFYYDIVEKNI